MQTAAPWLLHVVGLSCWWCALLLLESRACLHELLSLLYLQEASEEGDGHDGHEGHAAKAISTKAKGRVHWGCGHNGGAAVVVHGGAASAGGVQPDEGYAGMLAGGRIRWSGRHDDDTGFCKTSTKKN